MTAPATHSAKPRLIRTTKDLQAWSDGCRRDGRTIAMVPTMGALHAGHLSLVKAAAEKADAVVVSIFVNPTQFGPGEDFDAYPRTEAADVEKLTGHGVEVVFAPNAAEMYPDGFATTVTVGGPSAGLETDFRPHFFAGVATVVTKLLLAARPHYAVFGEKDYQQLLVVKRLARDLNIGTEIVGRPTVREADDLALSSRNAYLDAPAPPRRQPPAGGAATCGDRAGGRRACRSRPCRRPRRAGARGLRGRLSLAVRRGKRFPRPAPTPPAAFWSPPASARRATDRQHGRCCRVTGRLRVWPMWILRPILRDGVCAAS